MTLFCLIWNDVRSVVWQYCKYGTFLTCILPPNVPLENKAFQFAFCQNTDWSLCASHTCGVQHVPYYHNKETYNTTACTSNHHDPKKHILASTRVYDHQIFCMQEGLCAGYCESFGSRKRELMCILGKWMSAALWSYHPLHGFETSRWTHWDQHVNRELTKLWARG